MHHGRHDTQMTTVTVYWEPMEHSRSTTWDHRPSTRSLFRSVILMRQMVRGRKRWASATTPARRAPGLFCNSVGAAAVPAKYTYTTPCLWGIWEASA